MFSIVIIIHVQCCHSRDQTLYQKQEDRVGMWKFSSEAVC